MSQQNQKGEYSDEPPAYGAPYPQQGRVPYPQQGGAAYPPAGGAPYQQSGGAPYQQAGGAPYPPAGGAPYPPGYYPQQMGPVPTTVLVVPAMRFGETPVSMNCQYCHADIVTATKFVNGLTAWLISGSLCVVGCWLGCCLIPFCVDACKDVDHKCPNCHRLVGRLKRIDL